MSKFFEIKMSKKMVAKYFDKFEDSFFDNNDTYTLTNDLSKDIYIDKHDYYKIVVLKNGEYEDMITEDFMIELLKGE